MGHLAELLNKLLGCFHLTNLLSGIALPAKSDIGLGEELTATSAMAV